MSKGIKVYIQIKMTIFVILSFIFLYGLICAIIASEFIEERRLNEKDYWHIFLYLFLLKFLQK